MKLIVFVHDNLRVLAEKGELIENLYNPGSLFDEVHLFITNKYQPDPGHIQKTAGRAVLHIHNLPPPSFAGSLAWRPVFLRKWVQDVTSLAASIQPQLIRCQGFNIHTYLAARVKTALHIPAVVSLHGNPDVDYLRQGKNRLERFYIAAWLKLADDSMTFFDHIIAVYSPILPYLKRKNLKSYSVIYNIVGLGALPKTDYAVHGRVKCVTVGRQNINQKDQRNIVRAAAELENVELTVIGEGDLHDEMVRIAAQAGAAERMIFETSRSNDDLMSSLKDYDIYLYNSINFEISKSVMEAALIGLPIIHNQRQPCLSDELNQDYFHLVDNSLDGYREGLRLLIEDKSSRERLGQEARRAALRLWSPDHIEKQIVDLYTSLIDSQAGC